MSYNPYALALPAETFSLTSEDLREGGALPASAHATPDRPGESPELSWGAPPPRAKSLVITAFDADAPIPGGLWHWIVKDVPATIGGLAHDAASALPAGAVHLANDLGAATYSGAQPPPGTGVHRMFFCVTALDVASLDVPDGASNALVNILMSGHTVGRAVLVGTSTAPPA